MESDDDLPCTPIPAALAPGFVPGAPPLRPFPPMTEWLPISERDLRTTFSVAVSMQIQSLPQLKGKGAPLDPDRRRHAVAAFAERLLDHLIQSNIVFARGGPGVEPSQSIGSAIKRSKPNDER